MRHSRLWIVGLLLAVPLTAAGVFFARTDLGRADQYASVGSFFLALVAVCLSLFSALRSHRSEPAERESAPGARVVYDSEDVQMGDNSVMYVTRTVEPTRKKKRRRR